MSGGCDSWEMLIERQRDGELGRADRQRLEQHLASCDSCRAYEQQLEQIAQLALLPTRQAVERLTPGQLDRLWAGIASRLETEPTPGVLERLATWFAEFWGANRRVLIAAGAAACLTLLVAYPLLRQDAPAGAPAAAVASGSPVAVEAAAAGEVIVDSLQSGEHDMVLVNVHPEDMTTVIWLLGDGEEPGAVAPAAIPRQDGADAGMRPQPSAEQPSVEQPAGPSQPGPTGQDTDGEP